MQGRSFMNFQQFQARVLAVGLFAASVGGTFALFGCVPLLAQFTSPASQTTPSQFQAFPEISRRAASERPSKTLSPGYQSRQARAIYANSRPAERLYSLD